VGFIIPTGNLGNAVAALWAKRIGMPIGPVVLALNSNRGLADFVSTGKFTPSETIPTLANAMDVGNPSNLERLRDLYPDIDSVRQSIRAGFVLDQEIESEIRSSERDWGKLICPHTATAAVVRKRMDAEAGGEQEWALVSTAHPAKFETIVEPLIGHSVSVPPALAEVLKKRWVHDEISADYGALISTLVVSV
jgi:threonine synthase